MKNRHMKLIGLLSAAMLILSPLGGILAADVASTPEPISAPAPETAAQPPDAAEKPVVTYRSFTGKILSVREQPIEGDKLVSVENSEGGQAEFIVTAGAYRFDGAELTEGVQIAGYYDASLPMTLQYPPRYTVPVVAPVTEEYTVFVGLFDENLVSADNQLALQNTETSIIVDAKGEAFTGALAGHRLAVTYKVVTMSLPGQTTPIQVVVLPDPEPAPELLPVPADVSQLPIVVNGVTIDDPLPAYTNEGGVVMLPLRVTAEALGFDVHWDPVQRTTTLGKTITVTADRDYYIYARTAPIELGTAPEIKDSRTYVPLSFFTQVAQLPTAEVTGGQIVLTGPAAAN
jgi:hypothetical protein